MSIYKDGYSLGCLFIKTLQTTNMEKPFVSSTLLIERVSRDVTDGTSARERERERERER